MKALTSRLRRKQQTVTDGTKEKYRSDNASKSPKVDKKQVEEQSSDYSANSSVSNTPKLKKKFLNGKFVFSVSPSLSKKGSSNVASVASSPVIQKKLLKSTSFDNSNKKMGTSFASSSSLKSFHSLERGMTSPSLFRSFDEGMNSLNGSLTSLSLESSPSASTLSLSMTSQQFHMPLTEDQFREKLKVEDSWKPAPATPKPSKKLSTSSRQSKKLSTSSSVATWPFHKLGLKSPFRNRNNIPSAARRSSNVTAITKGRVLPQHKRSRSMCVGDLSEATTMLAKFQEDNEALALEVRGKEEELNLLNATMDQVNQHWANKVQALMRDAEMAQKKYEHLRTLIAVKEASSPQTSASRPVVRLPISDRNQRNRQNNSFESGEAVNKHLTNDSPKREREEPPLKSPPPVKRRGVREAPRRKGIAARACGKTEEVKAKLLNALLASRCLSQLSRDDLKNIVNVMKSKRINKGEKLMQEGTIGRAFYVLDEGECRIYKEGNAAMSPELARAGRLVESWSVFGDTDVFYHTKRVWSCRCLRQGMVWLITREEFRAAVMQQDIFRRRRENVYEFLKNLPNFNGLAPAQLKKFASTAKVEHYANGDYIFRQGGHSSHAYILKEGEVQVTKQIDGTETHQKTLTSGHLFGDARCHRHDHNVVAIGTETVQCIAVSLKDFEPIRELVTEQSEGVTPSKINENLAKRLLNGEGTDSDATTSISSGYGSDRSSPRQTRRKYSQHHDQFIEKAKKVHDKNRIDFKFIATIGNGAFGSVDLVSCKDDNSDVYAVKKLSKQEIVSSEQQRNVFSEKKLQMKTSLECPFIASLYSTFKDNRYVYFVMEYCPGGELFSLLSRVRSFDDVTARFYAGCVIEALRYLHSKHIVFRDLKPENVVLDRYGYCKLTDFGFAKQLSVKSTLRTYTYCGTPEYMAPEIILYNAHSITVDLWSLGVFIFEIVVGKAPFRNQNREKLAESILHGIEGPLEAAMAASRISSNSASIISELCHLQPADRLGSGRSGIYEVTKHKWFNQFNWSSLQKRNLAPPWKPKLNSTSDIRYFDSPSSSRGSGDVVEEFSGWDENF